MRDQALEQDGEVRSMVDALFAEIVLVKLQNKLAVLREGSEVVSILEHITFVEVYNELVEHNRRQEGSYVRSRHHLFLNILLHIDILVSQSSSMDHFHPLLKVNQSMDRGVCALPEALVVSQEREENFNTFPYRPEQVDGVRL
jgi:hypothetical protein